MNVVAMRKVLHDDFLFINDPTYIFLEEDILLVAGTEDGINKFSSRSNIKEKQAIGGLFRSFFPKR